MPKIKWDGAEEPTIIIIYKIGKWGSVFIAFMLTNLNDNIDDN